MLWGRSWKSCECGCQTSACQRYAIVKINPQGIEPIVFLFRQVMEELRVRLPDFQPATVLDFGSGPGTAIWAATSVSGQSKSEGYHVPGL